MAENTSSHWSPSKTYEFELKIGKLDLTPDLYSVSIITSIDVPYQSFILKFFADPNDIILEKIYGQTPLKLTSKLYGTSPAVIMEQIEFELMYLSSDMPLQASVPSPQNIQKDRQLITVVCVSRKAFITMNWIVNYVYHNMTIESIINDLISKTQATSKVDTQGANKEKIDQILIPSSTLYKNLKYLNRTFGIYDGMVAIFCSHDNKVYVKNLTAKMNSSNKFVIYQLPLGADNTKIIEKCTDGKNFYTRKNITTSYKGNSAFAFMAPNIKHIVKPKDRLFYTIDTNLEALSKEYGLISKGNKMFFDQAAMPISSRVSIHKDHTGYELSESFIRAKYARRVSAITEISVEIENSMRLLNLMEVGEAIKLDTQIDLTKDFNGMYILRASQLNFIRQKEWGSIAMLHLMRTNRTLT